MPPEIQDRCECEYSMITDELRRTVFLVDDDMDDMALAMRVLKDATEFDDIVTLSSGESLLNELDSRGLLQEDHDQSASEANDILILLDVHMPGESGINILKTLRKNPLTQNIPVFMLTEDSGTGSIEDTFYLRANGYLTKPLQHSHLNLIKKLYDGSKNPLN